LGNQLLDSYDDGWMDGWIVTDVCNLIRPKESKRRLPFLASTTTTIKGMNKEGMLDKQLLASYKGDE